MAIKLAKAEATQARLKIANYGGQGRGKTLTALLWAEWLAAQEGKRVAYIDTEHGTDFYTHNIPERSVHPAAFDFDAVYTRSLYEALEVVETLDTSIYSVVVIDSITHLWEAAKEAFRGKMTMQGGIPIQAWGGIKKPYKKLMALGVDGDFHFIICGREGVMMEENQDGEAKVVGKRMKSEGETPYEPHILFHFQTVRSEDGLYVPRIVCEKDRSGILTGKVIDWPDYKVIEPVYKHINPSGAQPKLGTVDDAAEKDAAAQERQEEKEQEERETLFQMIRTAILNARNGQELMAAWDLTKGKKGRLGEMYDSLVVLKDARKSEILKVA